MCKRSEEANGVPLYNNLKHDQIVGYTYDAENLCCDTCLELGDATDYSSTSTEDIRTAWAHLAGTDHSDERNYDSGELPKPIEAGSIDGDERCDRTGCGKELA